jgi:hypothetical protein
MGRVTRIEGAPLGGGRNSLMRASRSASLMSVVAAALPARPLQFDIPRGEGDVEAFNRLEPRVLTSLSRWRTAASS